MMWCLQDALPHLTNARLIGAGNTAFARVHSDTRSIQAGDLFVALKGDRFDAHDYLAHAKAAGAVAVLAQHGIAQAGIHGIQVPDSLKALGQLARAWRRRFTLPLAAVVGSNGKTTVTQMTASILRAHHATTAYATQGNFNNAIGVALTLLGLRGIHQRAVLELGMNHPGEIAHLSDMVAPTVAVVTNAQREHLEFMQSLGAVAQENGSVIAKLPATGTVVMPWEDKYTPLWQSMAGIRPVTVFAQCAQQDIAQVHTKIAQHGFAWVLGHAVWQDKAWQVCVYTAQGTGNFALHIAGHHNVQNALAAIATGLALGVSLPTACEGLGAFRAVAGRSASYTLQAPTKGHKTLVDDSYNANPDSVRAAIDVLANLPTPRLLILGDMGEVGNTAAELHAEVGAYAKTQGIDILLTHGALAQHASLAFGTTLHAQDEQSLLAQAVAQAQNARSILVKGSRFMCMERVVQALQAAYAPPDANTAAPAWAVEER